MHIFGVEEHQVQHPHGQGIGPDSRKVIKQACRMSPAGTAHQRIFEPQREWKHIFQQNRNPSRENTEPGKPPA